MEFLEKNMKRFALTQHDLRSVFAAPSKCSLRKWRPSVERMEQRVLLAGDLVARWLADDIAVEDGAVIDNWTDRVGGIGGFVQGTPTLKHNALGGRAVVEFNGSDGADVFRFDNLASPISGADDFTVALVFSTASNAATANDGPWFSHMGIVDSSTNGFATDFGVALNSSGQIVSGMGGGFGKPTATVFSTEQGLDNGESHVAIISRSATNLSVYVDDGPASSINNASSDSRSTTIDLVFGDIQSGGIPFSGQIAEVRFYHGAMNDVEASALHDDVLSFYQNAPPQANNDEYSTAEDPLLFVISAANGVLANDFDAESDPLTATLVDTPQHGSLTFNEDGSFIYSPETNFFGTDTFTYTADDFRPGTLATVSIIVTPEYDPATPISDSYKSLSGNVLQVEASDGVLANDLNPDLVDLTATLVDNIGAGDLTLNADGSFRFDPQQFVGTTSFTYQLHDGQQSSVPQTVTLHINTPPIANADSYEIDEDNVLSVTADLGVIANDIDQENDSLTATLVSPPAHGTMEFNADGSFLYTPNANYFGPDSFAYQLADWIDQSEIVTGSISVHAVDDPPNAVSDVYFTSPGTAISKLADAGVLANDWDVDSAAIDAQLVSGPSHGELQLDTDGSFHYAPNPDFIGIDSFSYQASDSNRLSELVEVQLFVGATPVEISEILTANMTSLSTRIRASIDDSFGGDARTEDWIEIQNVTDVPLDIGGFHLSDDPDSPRKWRIPDGTTIPASGFITVFASRLNITDPALDEMGMMHTNFTLQVEGEFLAINSPDGFILDAYDSYPLQVPDVTFGKTATGGSAYFLATSPGEPNGQTYDGLVDRPTANVERGFYSEAFQVELLTETANAEIRYTTDGSEPTLTNGLLYSQPVDITTTTTLRATAFLAGSLPSRTTTHSYVFLDDVINQGNSPEGYPDMFGLGPPDNHPWAPRPADYEMDPEITQSPRYKDLMDDALLAIPTVSIVTSIDNLFDTDIGIYQNTDNHGVDWERPASIEMILPDGSTAFQIDAGVRIQGGASREPWKSPKHGFRLKFKGIYGSDDLQYDWFGEGSVSKFDEIVLRAGANQAWTHHNNFEGDNRGRAQYIRDQWANDTYNAMGHAAPHNDYAHLYLNGLYWGLYNPKERPTADFMASYFGGEAHNYDVLNAGTVLDGDADAWRRLNSRDFRNLEDQALYDEFTSMLDIDSFADYMIMNHYGANIDWDSHNWYAARERVPDGKFVFIPWDEEFLFIRPNDNKIRSREAAPGRLLQSLLTNDEFRIYFADKLQKHLFNDGLLTPDSVVERWEARSSQITDAIIGESARWGDFRRDVDRQGIAGPFELLERDVQWMAERERLLNDYFPVRTGIVIEQYRSANYLPDTTAPVFSVRGGHISSTDSIELSNNGGTIYYTTDGSDPRLPGGGVNPDAVAYAGAFRLSDSVNVRTRALNGEEWSPLDEAFFVVDAVPAAPSNLRISEINFNPGQPSESEAALGISDNDEFEFIELVNISNSTLDLTSVQFVSSDVDGDTQGVRFSFVDQTLLAPNDRILVVENLVAFEARYGSDLPVAGQWSGKLSNGGEQITLVVGDQTIHQFTYDDNWFEATDGGGFTLEAVDATSADVTIWGLKEGWRASGNLGGSPGTAGVVVGDSNGDGVFDSSDLVAVFAAGEYEDEVAGNSTFEEGDWNGDGDFTSRDLVLAFQAGTYVDLVVGVDDPMSIFSLAQRTKPAISDRARTADQIFADLMEF